MSKPSFLKLRLASAAAGVAALCACSDSTAPLDTPLSQAVTSAHYTFRMAPGDVVDTTWQEHFYTWVVAELAVRPTETLTYFKYRNRGHLEQITGKNTNGFAEPGTSRFHTIWPIDNHEGVHTLVNLYIGHAPALFNEGIAVAHQTDPMRGDLTPRWNGQPLHTIARNIDAAGNLPPSNSLLTSPEFFSFDQNITYPAAGSFMRYLLDRYGLPRMKAFVGGAGGATFDDSALRTVTRFIGAYGKTVDEMWTEWRAWLRR